MFTEHPGIAKISFTGSIATGKKIMAACSKTLKRVTLELGGNDASIVREDVDIEATAPQLVMGAFQNSGQVCRTIPFLLVDANFFIRSALPPSVSTSTRRSTNP
jgi:acyl-CoA reductase-like NAD-dependent aldehyde dehydrogenase